jgi:hypothetical protein
MRHELETEKAVAVARARREMEGVAKKSRKIAEDNKVLMAEF